MNRKDAVECSVAKWAAIVAGHGEDRMDTNCALCNTYRRVGVYCDECPLLEIAPEGCDGKWVFWATHQDIVHDDKYPYRVRCPECEKLALEIAEELDSIPRKKKEVGEKEMK